MELYYTAIVKLSLGFICLIFQINLLGKGNLAPSSAMDQVQNYVLGGIIGGVIYNQDITILQFFLVLVIWTIVVFTLKFLKIIIVLPKISLMDDLWVLLSMVK